MFSILLARSFEKDAKALLKKYPSLRQELVELGESLTNNPTLGTPLGRDCYKIRLAIKSKGKGTRGGARVITYVITENEEVVLLSIYDKKEKSSLKPNELNQLLQDFE
jgi:mRNA-degrading endonuclease RelE of RelBE toxin-antitoxin system